MYVVEFSITALTNRQGFFIWINAIFSFPPHSIFFKQAFYIINQTVNYMIEILQNYGICAEY